MLKAVGDGVVVSLQPVVQLYIAELLQAPTAILSAHFILFLPLIVFTNETPMANRGPNAVLIIPFKSCWSTVSRFGICTM